MSVLSTESQIMFEEEEVLWAKIRGYPWWPAFVDKVHEPEIQDGEIQYTVFFFGDNTHSRLDSSKLRKFIDFYTDFYAKAKQHRKLMMSITKAEQKLKQNGQNVEVFEVLRMELKNKKCQKIKKKIKPKINSPIYLSNKIQSVPELEKSKTCANDRNQCAQIGNQQEYQEEEGEVLKQNEEEQQKEEEIIYQSANGKRKLRSDLKKNIEREVEPIIHIRLNEGSRKEEQKKINVEEDSSQRIAEVFSSKDQMQQLEVIRQKSQKIQQQQQKVQNEQQIDVMIQSSQSTPQEYLSNYQKKRQSQNCHQPKKRGRPKKPVGYAENMDQKSNFEESEEQNLNIKNRPIKRKLITKNIKKVLSPIKLETNKNNLLKEIRKKLSNCESLSEYLSSIDINTQNVQQILDLDVTSVLLDGQITVKVIELFETLKTTLLHKYFPDDLKIKKKYDKIQKKKNHYKNQMVEEEQQDNDEQNQLRKKTILKLQKILQNQEEKLPNAKQLSIQIEGYFRQADQTIGSKYRAFAYAVLRSLKDRKDSVMKVQHTLKNYGYAEQEQAKH